MALRLAAILTLLAALAQGEIIEDVRTSLAQGDFSAARSQLEAYRAQHGIDPAYLEALSWSARASLSTKQLDQAETYARQTESGSRQMLQHRTLDAEPHLPIALGAAFEVEAEVLEARGQNAQAAVLLRRALATYGSTSIRARLQKNLNLLGLTGQPAPPLSIAEYLGTWPTSLT